MGLTAMVIGSVSGFGMQMMNNALQKVPLSRREYFDPPITPPSSAPAQCAVVASYEMDVALDLVASPSDRILRRSCVCHCYFFGARLPTALVSPFLIHS